MRHLRVVLLALLCAEAALGLSTGPPTQRTGAAVDGGLDCTMCHRTYAPANSDPRGRILVEAVSYRPGVKQTIRISVTHPDAARWGFQLTARLATDERLQAGTFTVTPNTRVRCGAAGADAPCGGEQEFASHTQAATRNGSNGTGTFEVEWTPPAQEVGDIILYAAGNASDSSSSNLNDLIFTTRVLVRSATGCTTAGDPAVTAVVNAASGRPGIAFNTMLSIYGANLVSGSRQRSAQAFDLVDNRYPKQLDCIAVEVGGQRVPVLFVGDTQINVQAPSATLSSARLEVVMNPGTSTERRIEGGSLPLPESNAGFFTINGTSVVARHADGAIVALPAVSAGGRPARAGDMITLYGTGFGFTEPIWQSGEFVAFETPLAQPITVQIGATTLAPADIAFGGLAARSNSGVYEIRIRVPTGLTPGDNAVTLRTAASVTQTGATIPIAP